MSAVILAHKPGLVLPGQLEVPGQDQRQQRLALADLDRDQRTDAGAGQRVLDQLAAGGAGWGGDQRHARQLADRQPT